MPCIIYIMQIFRSPLSYKQSMQLALWVAMLSVVYQQGSSLMYSSLFMETEGAIVMVIATVVYAFFAKYRQLAVYVFAAGLLLSFVPGWYSAANHTWLAAWMLVPAVLFASWWKETVYTNYIRYTLGLVMIIAAVQKLIAQTYLDGSYIAWLSNYGSTTERAFSFVCSNTGSEVCIWYLFIGAAALLWQVVAGILILVGVKHFIFIACEVSFLLTVGLYADEMNFQVLNIALLCMAFQFGMSRWIAVVCIILLHIDLIGISEIIDFFYYGFFI